jgi:predicted dehydrogenase
VEGETNGVGADGVIITASAKSNDIISQAAQMSRKRGRIILVGVVGLNISRAEFYEKELSFQVSCSYGPGRYDDNYESRGIDYPLPFVRWTEKRNFEAILQSISSGKLHVKEMISEVVNLEDYLKVYGEIGASKSIASILSYKETTQIPENTIKINETSFEGQQGVLGIIGAGNFTKMTMLPALKKANAKLKYIASQGGVTGTAMAQKYGVSHSTTNFKEILQDNEVDAVLVTTRHNSHAKMACEIVNAGKHAFIEKPLALNTEELNTVIEAQQKSGKTVTVGFNRRFSPHAIKMKSLVGTAPMNVITTMNAGAIPANVWVHDMKIGGGRIIGEACHFIDLITYLTGSTVDAVCMNAMGANPEENTDNASILLKYKNGSTGVINYFANGSKSYSKERVEVYSQERTLVMDNFRVTKGYGFKGFSKLKTGLDKGHKNQFKQYVESLKRGGSPLIPFEEIVNTTKASFAAIQSLKENKWIIVE